MENVAREKQLAWLGRGQLLATNLGAGSRGDTHGASIPAVCHSAQTHSCFHVSCSPCLTARKLNYTLN